MFRSPKFTRSLAVGLIALGLVGGAACSSDGSDSGKAKSTTTVATGKADGGTTVSSQPTDANAGDTTTPAAGPSDDKQDYVDALTAAVSSDDVATPEQGTCIANAWIDQIGFDAIVGAGMSPRQFGDLDNAAFMKLDLTEGEAGQVYDAFDTCGFDFPAVYRTFATPPDATPAQKACVDDALSNEAVRSAFVKGLVEAKGDADFSLLFDKATACISG